MTIARPMSQPRADSMDSFSVQLAIGQREIGERISESRMPAEGPSRRNILGALAVLPVALPATVAAEPDPAFALIAAKRAADVAHCAAIDATDDAENRFGSRSIEADEADEKCSAACDEAFEAAWRLARTAPTTLAGVAAVLRFANEIEDEGNEWPNTDAVGPEGWHYQLRATMAAALETILRDEVRA